MAPGLRPDSRQMSCIVLWWKPLRRKQASAASMMSLLRSSRYRLDTFGMKSCYSLLKTSLRSLLPQVDDLVKGHEVKRWCRGGTHKAQATVKAMEAGGTWLSVHRSVTRSTWSLPPCSKATCRCSRRPHSLRDDRSLAASRNRSAGGSGGPVTSRMSLSPWVTDDKGTYWPRAQGVSRIGRQSTTSR